VANLIDRKLPRRLQVIAAVYGTWVERLRRNPDTALPAARRIGRAIALDAALVLLLTVVVGQWGHIAVAKVRETTGLDELPAWTVVVGAAVLLALPFCLGLMRNARRIALALADAAFPPPTDDTLDAARAPRRTLLVLLQLTVLLVLGLPYLAVTQPFLPGLESVAVLAALLTLALLALWRSAADLDGHIRAGAQLVVEAVAAGAGSADPAPGGTAQQIAALLPGIGDPTPFRVPPDSPALGRSLASLNLRGATGATVLAIVRGGQSVVVPTADEVLQAGDVLALAGAEEAVAAARVLLGGAVAT
jgi:CPA2 family monovalent cation:H+ antiporter-2